MISLEDTKTLVETFSGTIGLFDTLYPRLHYLFTGQEYGKSEPSYKIEKDEDGLVVMENGKSKQRVSYSEMLKRLDSGDLSLGPFT